MNIDEVISMDARDVLVSICNGYNLPVWSNPRDNLMEILQSGMVEDLDCLRALDAYDEYHYEACREDIIEEYLQTQK
jgi:hypothetical protein